MVSRTEVRWRLAAAVLFLLVAVVVGFSGPASAQAVQRSFINQSFESPNLGSGACYRILSSSQVPGWETTAGSAAPAGSCGFAASAGPAMELWANGFNGVTSAAGSQHAELNANEASRLYQNVCLVTGEQFAWQFSHRGRSGVDVMDFNIAPSPNGTRTQIARSSTNNTAWAQRTGTYTYTGASGIQTLGFEAISAAGGISSGNFLDNIQVTLTPYLEFQPGNQSGLENIATANLPTIRVSGTLTSAVTVQVTVSGTATRGTDYTTPNGAATFNVAIPAGDYNGTQLVATGIVVINDTLIEPSETIILTITPNPGNYTIAGTQTCGAAANAAATYTILDNDAGLTLRKALDSARAAASDQFTLTIAGANGPATATTTGSGAMVSGQAQLANVAAGTSYTISEAMAPGSNSPLGVYTPNLVCTNATTGSTTLLPGGAVTSATVTPAVGDNITCTFTNARRDLGIRLGKTWTSAVPGDAVGLTISGTEVTGATPGGSTAPSTTTMASAAAAAGSTVTLTEAITNGNPAHYTTTLVCTRDVDGGNVAVNGSGLSRTIAMPGNSALTCAFGNSRVAQTLALNKVWGAGGAAGHTASAVATWGSQSASFSATSPTNQNGTPVPVFAGEIVTLPAETFGGGATPGMYTTTVQCTGGSSLANGPVGRTLTITASTVPTVCTYTNNPVAADLVTRKTTTATVPVASGSQVTFRITVSNNGTADATGVNLTDSLPAGFTLLSTVASTGSVSTAGSAVTWTIGALANGASATLDLTGTVTGSAGQVIANTTGRATGDQQDLTTAGDSLTASVTIATPTLRFSKTAGAIADANLNGLQDAGDTVAYSFSLTNTGNVALDTITIADPRLPSLACTPNQPMPLAPGASTSFTCSGNVYTLQQADVSAGSVTNTATVSATPAGGTTPITANGSAVVTIVRSASMVVDKTVDRATISAPGTLNYTIVARNTGNVPLTGVALSDTISTGGAVAVDAPIESNPAGTAGVLDVGERWTWTATYAVTQPDLDAGANLVNTARVSTTEAAPASDTATTVVSQFRSLSVDKTVDIATVTSAPTLLTYTIRLRNTGNTALTNLVVADTLPDGSAATLSGPTGDADGDLRLDVGEVWIYATTYSVTQEEVDQGQDRVNTVRASADGVAQVQDDATTVIAQDPAVLIDKDVDRDTIAGPGPLNYTITVTNTGNAALQNVVFQDTLPNGTVITEAGMGSRSGDGGTPDVLDVGEVWTYEFVYNVSQAEFDAGLPLTNTITVNAESFTNQPTDSDSVTTSPVFNPLVSVSKSVDRASVGAPGTLTYQIVARNGGNIALTNVSLDDTISNGGAVTVGAPTESNPAGIAGVLDVDESWTWTATYVVTQADIDAGADLVNTAIVSTTEAAPARDTATTTIARTSGLGLVKRATSGAPYDSVGDVVTYEYVVTNTGNATLTQPITVSDDKIATVVCPALPAGGLAPQATLTCTASYAVTQADLDSCAVTNIATASDGTSSVTDSETVQCTQSAGLGLVKRATSGAPYDSVGDVVTYEYVVTNTGNATLTQPITVSDDKIATVVCPALPAGGLAPQATLTCTASYAVTQADLDSCSVTNIATASDGTSSVTDSETVQCTQSAGLGLVKRATSGAPYDSVGDVVTYEYVVTNTGNVTLTQPITVSDDKIATVVCPALPAGGLAPQATLTCTASYAVTQADLDSCAVTNIATASDGTSSVTDSETVQCRDEPAQEPALILLKTTDGLFDTNGDGVPGGAGDTITYRFKVTNTGNVTIRNVSPKDAGPRFNERKGAGSLSAFTPPAVAELAPGAAADFRATYVLMPGDVEAAAGIDDGVKNTATAEGAFDASHGTDKIETNESSIVLTLPRSSSLTLTKQANVRQIRIGQRAPFTITVTNNSNHDVGPVSVTDTMPAGFRFVEGSATVDGSVAAVEAAGRRVTFHDLNLAPGARIEIRLQLEALSTAGPGRHVNRAIVTDAAGNALTPEATAWVEILADPVFDCGDIIGKVFDDLNGDGYQNEGEPGLPGVRVVTVNGLLITTDQYGRFHVGCADLPDSRIGSNFILKLDERTLPGGYRLTTENPRVVRLTAGKLTKLNFGAQIGRVVRLDLKSDAFEPGTARLKPKWQDGLEQLISILEKKQSVLRLSYSDAGDDPGLAQRRMRNLETEISNLWRRVRGRYRLEIETRIGGEQ